MPTISHFINGVSKSFSGARLADVYDPSTGQVQAKVELANPTNLNEAVAAAKAAQIGWAAMNPQRRARVMFRFKGNSPDAATAAVQHRTPTGGLAGDMGICAQWLGGNLWL